MVLRASLMWVAALAAPAALAQGAPGPGGEAPPTPVTVVVVEPQDVTLTARLPGRIVASGVAEVRPQVNGLIVDRLFEEGAEVELGDPLYRIDSATYEAAVELANAEIAQAKARLTAAEKAANRARELVGRNVASEQALDEAISVRDAAAAALDVAEAQRHTAQIGLERTTIRAPLSGIIGRSLTTRGALVTAGQAEPLAIIRAIDPVLVDVTQSAAEIVEWRRKETEAELAGADPTVTLILADGKTYEHTGQLTAAEPHVDEQTGVVTLRMQFPNPDQLLLPGMYAEVEMPQGVARGAILVPMEGVSRDRRGRPTALVVNADNVVETRELTVTGARGSDWIVTGGLEAGDRLIVEGLQKIQPGVTVAPDVRAEPEPAVEAEQRASLPVR
jgi:membrane fusion protein, multidrug efflux system